MTSKTNPPLPFRVRVLGDEPVIVRNRFGGEKCQLTPEACAVYDATIEASMMAETVAPNDGDHPAREVVRKGIAWFREYYPAEYMILLD